MSLTFVTLHLSREMPCSGVDVCTLTTSMVGDTVVLVPHSMAGRSGIEPLRDGEVLSSTYARSYVQIRLLPSAPAEHLLCPAVYR